MLRTDAPELYAGLTGRALPLVILSGVGGLGSLALMVRRRFTAGRFAAAAAVTAIIWGWAVAQYPAILVGELTISEAASDPAMLRATLISLLVGAVLLVPSFAWLFLIFQSRGRPDVDDTASAADR